MGGAGERGNGTSRGRKVLYCLVPRDLARKLHGPLRRHFLADLTTEVVVERRTDDRRGAAERRIGEPATPAVERRRIRNVAGRRIGERRAAQVGARVPALPRRFARHADRLTFVERLEPSGDYLEDLASARLVMRIQAGDRDAFTDLYMRYFDRVYGYVLVVLRNRHQAEDATQQIFMRAWEALPQYERRGQPFAAWLFTIVKHQAIQDFAKLHKADPMEPEKVTAARDRRACEEPQFDVLSWISDRELMLFIERLPLPQRQALVLRYMLDLPSSEVARILERSPDDVRQLQSRAIRFLRDRLVAVGRQVPARGEPTRMRSPLRAARVLRRRRFALR